MSDLERRLQNSLRTVGEGVAEKNIAEARARFLARRRRRAIARYSGGVIAVGAVAAIAFLAVGLRDSVGDADQAPAPPAAGPSIQTVAAGRVAVGDAPSGVGSGDGYVWVANSGDDSVVQVDAHTKQVVRRVRVSGGPDDVLVNDGYAWVATGLGEIVAIETTTGKRHSFPAVFAGGSHLDIASDVRDGLWVAEGGGSLWHLRLRPLEMTKASAPEFGDLSDVATLGRDVWVYDRAGGRLARLDPMGENVVDSVAVGSSLSADVAVAPRSVWVYLSDDGTLLKVDKQSGEVVFHRRLGGAFGALTEDAGVIYVMVADGGPDGNGRLYGLDEDSGKPVSDPVPLSDFPVDVEAGPDGVWVTNGSGDTLTQVKPAG